MVTSEYRTVGSSGIMAPRARLRQASCMSGNVGVLLLDSIGIEGHLPTFTGVLGITRGYEDCGCI